jgi:D-alanyl-D-alanine carboxypeptidase
VERLKLIGRLAVCATSLTLLAGPIAASAAPPAESRAARADALMAEFVRPDEFSGVVLIAKDGKPVFRKAYGLANREWNVPNVATGKFRIGSMTKAFTATAILQLQEAGKLSIDDPISKYYAAAPASWHAVTLRHLLTHTSGIPSYTDLPNFFAEQSRLDRTPEEIIKLTQDAPLQFVPGSKFSYDNTGYIILGYVIEKVSGQTYADYVRQHILAPLGMKDSGYDVSETVLPQRAAGYANSPSGVTNAPFLSMTLPFAAGSIYSTVDDLLTWDQALYAAGKPLGAASLKAMFTDNGHGYGFGWGIADLHGHRLITHAGGINGFVSEFERYPDDKLTVIVLSNYAGAPVGEIGTDLAAIYLDIPPRTAAPGGEAAIRRMVDQVAKGAPDYDSMSAQLGAAVKAQLPLLQKNLAQLGALRTVTLQRAEPDGSDKYRVEFAHGAEVWLLKLGAGGKVESAQVGPTK